MSERDSVPIKVSAYVPAFNSEKTIARSLESLFSQSLPLDEIFVVDDGSTDCTAQIAETLGVKVIRTGKNLGRGAARRLAISEARNEIVLNCDSRICPSGEFVKSALAWFEDPNVSAVFGRIYLENTETLANRWAREFLYYEHLNGPAEHNAGLITTCMLSRKSHLLSVGNFDANMREHEDVELGERLLQAGYDVVFDPALKSLDIGDYSVANVLDRYCRWNYECKPKSSSPKRINMVTFHFKKAAKHIVHAVVCLCVPFYFAYRSIGRSVRNRQRL